MNRRQSLVTIIGAMLAPWQVNGEKVARKPMSPCDFKKEYRMVIEDEFGGPWTLNKEFDKVWGEGEEGDPFARVVFSNEGKVEWVFEFSILRDDLVVADKAYDVKNDQEWEFSLFKMDWKLPPYDPEDFVMKRISEICPDPVPVVLEAIIEPSGPYMV